MGKTSLKTRLIVPLLALVFAFAFAPAAFATDLAPAGDGDLPDPSLVDEEFGIGAGIKTVKITVSGTTQTYTGKAITPKIAVTDSDGKALENEKDYFMWYEDNVNVGTGSVVICAYDKDDAYVKDASFKIVPASIKKAAVKVTNEVYTGKKVKPATLVTFNGITLKKGTDYTLTYGKNKKVGKGTVTIKGKGNFTGSVTKKFKIMKASLKNAKISDVKDKVYTGNSIKPNVKIKFNGKVLKKGRDYKLNYAKNKNVGVAKIKITGKGNFKGKRTVHFAITARSISDCSASVSSQQWTGDYLYPAPYVSYKGRKLSSNDYVVSHYKNNADVGTAEVYIRGKRNFKGTRKLTFPITARSIKDAAIYVNPNPLKAGQPWNLQVVYNGRTLGFNSDYTYTTKQGTSGSVKYMDITIKAIEGSYKHFKGSNKLRVNIV